MIAASSRAFSPEEKHFACLRSTWPAALQDKAATPLISTRNIEQSDLQFMVDAKSALPLFGYLEDHPALSSGLFLKLAGFSFKDIDAFDLLGNGRVGDTADLGVLLGSGLPRRMFWALNACLDQSQPAVLEVHKWEAIPPHAELRVFICNRELAGVSQYHRHVRFPEYQRHEDLEALLDRITRFSETILSELPPFDLAADVVDHGTSVSLLELNPLTPRTDLGLFNHSNLRSANGQLRVL